MAGRTAQAPAAGRRLKPWVFIAVGLLPLALLAFGGLYLTGGDEATEKNMDTTPFLLSPDEAYPAGALPDDLLFDMLVLEKNRHRLTAFHNGRPVRVYLVALGFNPVGHKEVSGDGRTPEGRYIIDGKNPNSAYHKNIGISYPNRQDREHAAALGQDPGGDIKIHGLAPRFAGLGQAHRIADWTHGCVAVTNPEIEEIYQRTPVGTPIQILP